jgi:predicted flap endonuclease-1-like 5' DNA nuclease
MHRIGEVEDIDGDNEAKLVGLGVRSTDDLLTRAASPAGRSDLASSLGVSADVVLRWANCADLMRVDGIGMQFADLLEEAGVDTIPELAQRNAANLHVRVVEINTERTLTGRTPTADEVAAWIVQARALPRILEYGGGGASAPAPAAAPAPAVPAAPVPVPVPAPAPIVAAAPDPAPTTRLHEVTEAPPERATGSAATAPAEHATAAPLLSAVSNEPAVDTAHDAGSTAPSWFSGAASRPEQATGWLERLLARLRGSN